VHDAGLGSNAWALAGWRTTTGKALLCNDMHLRITTPGIWHLIHLQAGDYQVSGVSLPGVPGILVGHNARIAWGCTLAFTDNQDLFVERLDPGNPNRYAYKDAWQACATRDEAIAVKGRAAAHVETVRQTRHGPLVGGLVKGGQNGLALSSYALRPSQVLAGFAALNRAQGWDDFVAAMRLIQAPPLNVVYADVAGNIGHWVAGTLPVRAKGQGTVPAPGWSGDHEWVGEVPFEEMPHALNPACGYLVSCNHCLMPAGQNGQAPYPHFLGLHWMNGYRAQRVTAEIERLKVLSAEDCQRLQLDLRSLPGLALAERLQRWQIAPADPDAALGLKLLLAWDGWLDADSVGGCAYQVTMQRLLGRMVAPALGEPLFTRFLGGQGPHALLAPNSEFSGHASVTMLALLDQPESAWVTAAGGRAQVLEECLAKSVRWLRQTLGADPAGWRWGRLHTFTAQHALAVRKPLEQVFSLGPYPMGGDTDTVCQTAFVPDAPYQAQAAAPSYRQIVDLGDLGRTVHIAPPGNSGVLGDKHYDDLLPLWLRGEYVPAPWSREAVAREAVARLGLEPKGA
jgi:penicillin amidase